MTRAGNERTGSRLISIPAAAGEVITEGTMAVINAAGYAQTARAAEGLIVAGCVQNYCDNRNGADGGQHVQVKRGTFVWENDGTIQETDLLKTCYVKDAVTVTLTAEGSSAAGIILEAAPDGVTVDMTQHMEAAAPDLPEDSGEETKGE